MRNDKEGKSTEKHSNKNPIEKQRKGNREANPSHKEVKVLLALIASVLIFLVAGSRILNSQGDQNPRLEALEEALLNSKSRMLREYDPLLIEGLSIHDYRKIRQGREHDFIAVEIEMRDLSTVYDYFFEEMIHREVWKEEEILDSLQEIYQEAVNQGEMAVYSLEEELLLKEENGNWFVDNPRVLDIVLPKNPTEDMAKDFEKILGALEVSYNVNEEVQDPVLQEVMKVLDKENFFHQVSFDWQEEEGNYHLISEVHEVMKIWGLMGSDRLQHRREEIVDRSSLVDVLVEEVKKETISRREVKTYIIRKVGERSGEKWGYRLDTRGGPGHYYQSLMEDLENFGERFPYGFRYLENYYTTTRITEEAPWPEPLVRYEEEDQEVVARNLDLNFRREVLFRGDRLWYQKYDPENPEEMKTLMLDEKILKEELFDENGRRYHGSEILQREGYDLVIAGREREHFYRVDHKPELRVTKISMDVGLFHRGEVFYLGGRPYHMGQMGEGRDGEVKMLQLTDLENEEKIIDKSFDQLTENDVTLRGDYFVSEIHDLLLVYYQGPEKLLEEKLPDGAFQIYRGKEEGLELDERFLEVLEEIKGIQSVQVMDSDRIFIKDARDQEWIVDFKEEKKEKATFLQAQNYQFTPLEDNLYFVEALQYPDGRLEIFQREIWKVHNQGVGRWKLLDEGENNLTYAAKDQVFIQLKENQELSVFAPDFKKMKEILGGNNEVETIDFEKPEMHEAFTLLDRYQYIKGDTLVDDLPFFGRGAFYHAHNHLYPGHNAYSSELFRYDRTKGNLFYLVPGVNSYLKVFYRDQGHEPLLPLWDHQEIRIDKDFNTLYYRDHISTKIYDLEAIIDSLKVVSAQN